MEQFGLGYPRPFFSFEGEGGGGEEEEGEEEGGEGVRGAVLPGWGQYDEETPQGQAGNEAGEVGDDVGFRA